MIKISTIPQVYRNVSRWREILGVLSKYGLADWLSRFELPIGQGWLRDNNGQQLREMSRDERIRRALEELGPTFIKLGQLLSTRPDQVGVPLAEELAKLQSGTPADGVEWVRGVIAEDFGREVEACFATFEEQPVASASIGQVHRATLNDGRAVAVKVLHEGIRERVHVDSDILIGMAELAERLPELRNYRPVATAQEFQRTIRRELDFTHERRRLEQFAAYFEGDDRIRMPAAVETLCSQRVMTAEWLDGRQASDPELRSLYSGEQLSETARHGAEVFTEMIFDHGVYHADPHPGNVLVMPDGAIGLIDFGMVGRLTDSMREDLEDMVVAVVSNEPSRLTSVLVRVGATPPELDEAELAADIGDFVEYYGNQSVGGLDLAAALTELVEIIQRRQVTLPAAVSMLLKMLVQLEGTARLLSPNFSLLEVIQPQQRKMMLRRYSPLRRAKKAGRIYNEFEQLAEVFPQRLRDILQQVQSGKFDVHLDHRGLEPSVNRLVLGMMTSALFLGASLLLSRSVWPIATPDWPVVRLLSGVSLPGLAGLALSGLLGLRVLRAISKSGRLERRK
ncbi:MAG: AarF/UbiB family protein [Planctomycetota bacterium]